MAPGDYFFDLTVVVAAITPKASVGGKVSKE